MSDAASYRQRKEDFVSNLSGGDVSEIAAVAAVAPVAFLLWSVLQARQSFFRPYTTLAFFVDYLLNVGSIVLVMTLYASQSILLSILLIAPAAVIFVLPPNADRRKKAKVPPKGSSPSGADSPSPLPLKPFLTTYRATMLIATCIGILAVDFPMFPRRFAKVETWGTSLMDMGVGAFVFSGGVVAARPVLKERIAGRKTSVSRQVLGSLWHSIPLLVLGVIRLLSVKGLEYAEHVTEYGVHWNFFFTLGLLPPFVAASNGALRLIPSHAILALITGGAYQALLETTSLKSFVLTAPRTSLVAMNREGLCSFWGYLAIFLAGQDLGMLILPRSTGAPKAGGVRTQLIRTVGLRAALWTFIYFVCTDYKYGLGLTVSRRMANLPYVLWVASFSSLQLLVTAVIDTTFFPGFYDTAEAKVEQEVYETATSRVLKAYNRNGLAIFLLANLLTGLVNMTVNTLDATPLATMGILVVYTFATTAVAVGLDVYDISIKI